MQVAELFEQVSGRLPMVPKVVQELIASFQQESVNIDEITDKVAHDQVLSARVLRLANTARYGGNRRVGSLDDAVVLLGFDNLRMLVIASGLSAARVDIPGFDMPAFWKRSFEMANTAKRIARAARQDVQLAYTCGLLANIGELVLHLGLPDQEATIDKMVRQGADRVTTERAMLGMDLTEVGAELARRWNFPNTILQAIRYQHEPQDCAEPLAVLLALTTSIVEAFNQGLDEVEVARLTPEPLLERIGLPRPSLIDILPELKETSTMADDLL